MISFIFIAIISTVGIIKLIEVFVELIISIANKNKDDFAGIKRMSIFAKTVEREFYILPCIRIDLNSRYLEIQLLLFNFTYYQSFSLKYDES